MKYPIPFLLICLTLFSIPVFAFLILPHRPMTDEDYVDAIVGEASNQTEDTMVCIAHSLRNRGTLKGVFGYHAKHNKNETKLTWRKARIAWNLSEFEADNTGGSKNFGTQEDLDHYGHWTIKAKCGDFYFW